MSLFSIVEAAEEDDDSYFDAPADKASDDLRLLRESDEHLRRDFEKERELEKEVSQHEENRDSFFAQASIWLREFAGKLVSKPADEKVKEEVKSKEADIERLKEDIERRCREAKDSLSKHRLKLSKDRDDRSELTRTLRKSKMASLASRAKKFTSGDLVFVMDCTGSMTSFIKAAADQCCRIIDNVQREGGAVGSVPGSSVAPGAKIPLRVRFGFVAYRDYDDGQLHLQHHDLTEDADSVKRFIQQLKPTGGGDGPEDVVGGLRHAAEKLTWFGQHRAVFLFADAPNHGLLLHDGTGDSYPRDPRTLQAEEDIPKIMAEFRKKNTDFFFVKINESYTNKMEAQFKRFFGSGEAASGATFSSFALNSTAAGFFEAVGSRAVASMSRSITTGITATRLGARALTGPPPADLDMSEPTWPEKEACKAKDPCEWTLPRGWTFIRAEQSFCFMVRHTDVPRWTTRQCTLIYRKRPFACGAMRAAYYFYDPESDEQLVGKRYLGAGATEKTYDTDVCMQHFAQCLAKDANQRLSQQSVMRAFNFVLPWKARVPETGETFSMEFLLKGDYKKWNNNNGWLDDSAGGLMAAAFSHFSHVVTSGQSMVVDIQGVSGWCFTDPQVHSTDRKAFGIGNLGERGMANFYLTHQCSSYCRLLGARPERKELQPIQILREVPVATELKAFCSICGCADVKINERELARKAIRRHDVFCKRHFERYHKTIESRHCDQPSCKQVIQYSSWYIELRGQSPPSKCVSCKRGVDGRATDARMLIHRESAETETIVFGASEGLAPLLPTPTSHPSLRPASSASAKTTGDSRTPSSTASPAAGSSPDFSLCSAGHRNNRDSKFCGQCGGPIGAVLCSAGHENIIGNKFCNECGKELPGAAAEGKSKHAVLAPSSSSFRFDAPNRAAPKLQLKPATLVRSSSSSRFDCLAPKLQLKPATLVRSSSSSRFDCLAPASQKLGAEGRPRYPTRDDYLLSDEGRLAAQEFVQKSGVSLDKFKRVACDFFARRGCNNGSDCSFVHDEFDVPSKQTARG